MATSATPPIKLLNPDVLREIFLRLSKYELLDVTCVCREWNHVAQRLIDQTLEIVGSVKMQEANLHLLGRLQQDSNLRHRAKDLFIKEWYLDDLPPMPKIGSQIEDPWQPGRYFSTTYVDKTEMRLESKELVTHLCQALALMDLSSFTWSALLPLPVDLVEVLAIRPPCTVHIRRHERAYGAAVCSYSPTLNHVQSQNLARLCSQLTTLELLLPPEDPLILSALGALIVSSPKLKCLKLYVLGKLYGGFKVHIIPTRPVRGTIFSAVRTMDWLQRPLSTAGRRLALEELELDNFCLCDIPDFTLNTITDVSGLRKIGLSCFSILRNDNNACSLRTFRLHCHRPEAYEDRYCLGSWSASEVREKLSQCSRLQDIDLLDGTEILDRPLLERLGPQVKILSLRQVFWPDETSEYDLDLVSKMCPRLRSLTVDIPNPRLFTRLCSELTTMFHNLEQLKVCRSNEGLLFVDFYTPDPHLYTATLSDLRAIWDKMYSSQSKLLKLTLYFGLWKPWDRDVHFFMTGQPYAAQAAQAGTASRSYVTEVALPARMIADKPLVRTKCLEIEEANRAIRHRWQWLDGFSRVSGSWEEHLNRFEEIAVHSVYLVRRQTPNAQGEFTQRMTCQR